jgi:hypothetical protein
MKATWIVAAAAAVFSVTPTLAQQSGGMSFFVTSVGLGKCNNALGHSAV